MNVPIVRARWMASPHFKAWRRYEALPWWRKLVYRLMRNPHPWSKANFDGRSGPPVGGWNPHRHTWELRGDRFEGPREKYCTSCCVSLVRYPEDEPYEEIDLSLQLYT